jgi:hypothetical protein
VVIKEKVIVEEQKIKTTAEACPGCERYRNPR